MPEKTAHLVEIYRDISQSLLSAKLSTEAIINRLVEEAAGLTGASFVAYFRNTEVEGEPSWEVAAVYGAEGAVLARMGKPAITPLFAETFVHGNTIRSADVTQDPLYGSRGGPPAGHCPVRSYLALPVLSATGKPQGAMLLGHPDVGVFEARAETIMGDIVTIAALALNNARQYEELQHEAEYRQLLLAELNHRVKNVLATVQGMVNSTLRSTENPSEFAQALTGRIQAISATHNLLTETNWTCASLRDVVEGQVRHYCPPCQHQVLIDGPPIKLQAASVPSFGMFVHELTTNSVKYGALSSPGSALAVRWSVVPGEEPVLRFTWTESDGPPVREPTRIGFGTRLLRSIERQFGGSVELIYDPSGLICKLDVPLACVAPSQQVSPFTIPPRKEPVYAEAS